MVLKNGRSFHKNCAIKLHLNEQVNNAEKGIYSFYIDGIIISTHKSIIPTGAK